MTRKEIARRRTVAKVKAGGSAKTRTRITGTDEINDTNDTNDANDDNDRKGHDERSSSPARRAPAAVVVRRGRGATPSSSSSLPTSRATTQEEGTETAAGQVDTQVDTQCSWLILGDCYKVR